MGVNADGDALAIKSGTDVRDGFGGLACLGAEDDTAHAGIEGGLDFFHTTHPSAEFTGNFHSSADFGDGIEVLRFTAEGGVEIDDVEPISAGVLPLFGERHRVGGINGFLGGESALEAHDFAAHEVDGWQKNHSVERKLRRRASPADWLFSGWN